jgi:hypothetical protein
MEKKSEKQTTPKGYEIPIPKRGYFFHALKAAAKPSRSRRSRKK